MKHKTVKSGFAQCARCSKTISKRYTLCFECDQRQKEQIAYQTYLKKTEEEKDIEREIYYSRECSMCGKEGADWYGEKLFCGTCWTVWNS